MLNTIKMDLYRAFKSKSLYITILIAAISLFANIASLKYETLHPDKTIQTTQEDEMFDNVGIIMGDPVDVGDDFTVQDVLTIIFQGGTILALGAVFCATFVSIDHSSGFIKNVVGRNNYRKQTSMSKVIVMAVYTVLEITACFITLLLSLLVLYDDIRMGSLCNILGYLGVQILIQTSLLTLCVFICNLLRNIGIAMAFAISLSAGLFALIPQMLDKLNLPVTLCDYVLSIFVRTLPIQYDSTLYLRAIIVSVTSLCIFLLGSTFAMKRQDIK